MTQLHEKHRPLFLSQVVGQGKAVTVIGRVIKRGWGGRAWWISGQSGTGKTTLGRIIASNGADELFTLEYDSGDAVRASDIASMESNMHFFATGKGGRAFIINEAHGLPRSAVRLFLGILERIPSHVVFIFTTTKTGQKQLFDDNIDAHPLLSRCTVLELEHMSLPEVFARHCKSVAEAEGLDGKPLGDYIKLAQQCKSNCREMLMKIEAGAML